MEKNTIPACFIAFVLGIGLTAGLGYYAIYRPTVAGYRADVEQHRLDAERYRGLYNDSVERIAGVQGVIDQSIGKLTGTVTTISEARRQIRIVIETIQQIRESLKDKELDNDG